MKPMPSPKELLTSLIATMRQESVVPTRTRLMKFLYLADLHHARHHDGKTLTNWLWRVGSFGPLATEALDLLQSGEDEGWLRCTVLGSDDEDSAASIYELLSPPASTSLDPRLGAVRRWIKKYGDDTNQLLAFVYGNTEPMLDAEPGELLDFSVAEPINTGPLETPGISKRSRKKLSEALARMVAADTAHIQQAGHYDDTYFSGLPREEDLVVGMELDLSFDDSTKR